jgi:SAM-dependent methyltransferase
MKEEIVDAFNKLAVDYEHTVDNESVYNTHYERPAMLHLLPEDLSGLSVLDAGCAAGWYTEQLIKRGATVTSIDASPKMVEATKRRIGAESNVLLVDLNEELPFATGTFDIIVSSLTLHYVEDWQKLFRQFQRLLKQNGMFLYSVQHPFIDFEFSKVEGKTKGYYETELVVFPWHKRKSGKVDVPFYRRPLQKILKDTRDFFTISEVIEPQPIPALKEIDEARYAKLMTTPSFLLIKSFNHSKST